MAGEESSGTFWSRRSRKGKAALAIGGVLVALVVIAYALPDEQPEPASAEVTTSVVTNVVTTTVEEEEEPEPTATGETEEDPSPETTPSPPPPPPPPPKVGTARVARVVDGDTIDLANGKTVRLVQIDTPESSGECYGREAGSVLAGLLPAGARVRLERDPALDDVDRYGRILRYVHRGGTNVNLALVRRGAASVWFFDGDRGRYADPLLATARKAREQKRGAWGACRATLDPSRGFETRVKSSEGEGGGGSGNGGGSGGGNCMEGYSPCLPITGDLDCADVRALGKAPVRVTGADPYRLDGDDDGYGCE